MIPHLDASFDSTATNRTSVSSNNSNESTPLKSSASYPRFESPRGSDSSGDSYTREIEAVFKRLEEQNNSPKKK